MSLNLNTVRRNPEVNLHDLGLGKGFLDRTSKVQVIKEKGDNLDFIKIKNVFSKTTPILGWKDKLHSKKI